MRRSILLLPCLAALVLLAGCGNKGPLVMPSAQPAAATSIAPAPPSSAPSPAASTHQPG